MIEAIHQQISFYLRNYYLGTKNISIKGMEICIIGHSVMRLSNNRYIDIGGFQINTFFSKDEMISAEFKIAESFLKNGRQFFKGRAII